MNNQKKTRDSGIELLRIIVMMGVITLHYNNASIGGGLEFVQTKSVNEIMLYFFESLSIFGVNLFVLLSGYYLCKTQKRDGIKIVDLFIQESVFKIAIYFAEIIQGKAVFSTINLIESAIPNNYFVILYATTYIVSPYINLALKQLNRQSFRKLIITVLLVFSVWTIVVDIAGNIMGMEIKGLSTIGAYGSQNGYTIVNFLMMYIIGAYLQMECNDLRPIGINILLIIADVLLIMSWALVEHNLGLEYVTAWYYNNPLVVLLAIHVFQIFRSIKFYSAVVNELAKAAFTCFLFHCALLGFVGIKYFVNARPYLLLVHILLVPILLYLASYIAYRLYRICFGWIIKALTPLVNKVNLSCDKCD